MKWKRIDKEQPPRDGRPIIFKPIDSVNGQYKEYRYQRREWRSKLRHYPLQILKMSFSHWIDPSEILED